MCADASALGAWLRHGYNGGRIFDVEGGEAVTASGAGESGGSSQHSIFLLSIPTTRITRRGYARLGSRLPEGRRRGASYYNRSSVSWYSYFICRTARLYFLCKFNGEGDTNQVHNGSLCNV